MNHQFLHISFDFKGTVDKERLEEKFNLAVDWVHYLPACWIVYTTSSAQKWYERLKPLLGPEDLMFVCKVDLTQRQGWLPKWAWEWVQKYTASQLR